MLGDCGTHRSQKQPRKSTMTAAAEYNDVGSLALLDEDSGSWTVKNSAVKAYRWIGTEGPGEGVRQRALCVTFR